MKNTQPGSFWSTTRRSTKLHSHGSTFISSCHLLFLVHFLDFFSRFFSLYLPLSPSLSLFFTPLLCSLGTFTNSSFYFYLCSSCFLSLTLIAHPETTFYLFLCNVFHYFVMRPSFLLIYFLHVWFFFLYLLFAPWYIPLFSCCFTEFGYCHFWRWNGNWPCFSSLFYFFYLEWEIGSNLNCLKLAVMENWPL